VIRIGSGSVTGYALVLCATLIWSGNFIIARALSDSIPPVTLAFLRWLTAVLVFLPFGLRTLYRNAALIRKHIRYLALTGLLGVTLFNTIVYIAADTSAAFNLSLMAICSPAFVVVFARIFLADPFTIGRIVGLFLAMFGVILLVTEGQLGRLIDLTFTAGDIWMLIAAAVFAGYSILVGLKPAELGSMVFLGSIFILGLLFLLPWLAWELAGPVSIRFSWTAFGCVIYLGVGTSLLAFLCWNHAIALIGPARAAIAYYCLPLFSGVEALILLDEPIHLIHVVSGILVLGGIIIATKDRSYTKQSHTQGET
jgi:drug/metabolite transporter (DMT)-like permease